MTRFSCGCLNSNVGPSSPSWAYSACRFSQGSVQLSWNAPSVAPECCDQYLLRLSNGSVYNTSETSVTVSIGTESVTTTVDCIAHDGETLQSEDMIINSSKQRLMNYWILMFSLIDIAIKHITIEPLNSSCNATTNYQISWVSYKSCINNFCYVCT